MKVVIVGSGFGGVKTALQLVNKPGIHVTLVSPHGNFEYHGALYRSATGRSPLEVVIPLRDIFARAKNVEIVLDAITGIDPTKQRLIGENGGLYPYDEAVIAMGSVINYYGLSGMEERTHSVMTIADTVQLRYGLVRLFRSHIVRPKIIIVGAGPIGVELAGELQHFNQLVARKYSVKPKRLGVTLIEGADRVLPGLQPAASSKAARRLHKLDIKVLVNTRVNSCEPGKLCLDSGDLEADLIVWTAGTRQVDFFVNHPHVFTLARGKVKVNEYLEAAGQSHIYVIGDNAATPFSGMAQTAIHDALFVAQNLLRQARGRRRTAYQARHPIYVVPIGPRWALLQTEKRIMSGYRAWLVRRRADLWIFRNFEPYKKAVKTWRQGNHLAGF